MREPKLAEEVEDHEEQKRQAELRRAQDHLQKCKAQQHEEPEGAKPVTKLEQSAEDAPPKKLNNAPGRVFF